VSLMVDLKLDLGDGTFVESDMPTSDIRAALLRMRAALAAGRMPRRADHLLVMDWMELQDRKHGGIRHAGTLS
jgi:hypothetical protein